MRAAVGRAAPAALAALLLLSCTSSAADRRGNGSAPPTEVGSLPTAGGTGKLAGASGPSPSVIPSGLRRPLRFPEVAEGERCPKSSGRAYSNDLFGGTILGRGLVLPLVAPARARDVAPAARGVLVFRRSPEDPGWLSLKTLWFSFPRYRGPVLVRGRQLDGAHAVVFGETPTLAALEGSAGPTVNGGHGFREWPGATWLRALGCYAWQVDGSDFSRVIVFEAVGPSA